jgi:hypothetical protein
MKPWTPKRVIILLIVLGVAVWALSPLFYEKKVDESLDDLLQGAIMLDDAMEEKMEVKSTEGDESTTMEVPAPGIDPAVAPEEMLVKKAGESMEGEVMEEEVMEEKPVPPTEPEQRVAKLAGKGSFEGLARHNAVGTAELIEIDGKYFVRFESDFKVTNGPDLFVDFGKDGQHDSSARLGKLKGSTGGQNYEVPAGINVDDYNEVWVWCRAFSVPFGKALLK